MGIIDILQANDYMSETETEKKVKLKMNGIKIHSIDELRDNFNPDTIIKKYNNGKLVKWLDQHYYINEANAIRKIKPKSKNLLKRICVALDISYNPVNYMNEEENANYEKRKTKLAEFTDDENVINNAHFVAFNQEELAELISAEEDVIYLFNNKFSIPITIPNKHYIGIGEVKVKPIFTKQQYERAGITVENIPLPEDEDPKTEEMAKEAAYENGYDDFSDTHCELATEYHNALKVEKYANYHILSWDTSACDINYSSRYDCLNAAYTEIQKAYDLASNYFNVDSKKSLAKECAKYYSNIIESTFNGKMYGLESLCLERNTEYAYYKLCNLISQAKSTFKKAFRKELVNNASFYKLCNIDYYKESIEVDEIDDYISPEDDILGQIFERIFSGPTEYTTSDIYTAINDLENDLDTQASYFYSFAYDEYINYVQQIEAIIEEIGTAEVVE